MNILAALKISCYGYVNTYFENFLKYLVASFYKRKKQLVFFKMTGEEIFGENLFYSLLFLLLFSPRSLSFSFTVFLLALVLLLTISFKLRKMKPLKQILVHL